MKNMIPCPRCGRCHLLEAEAGDKETTNVSAEACEVSRDALKTELSRYINWIKNVYEQKEMPLEDVYTVQLAEELISALSVTKAGTEFAIRRLELNFTEWLPSDSDQEQSENAGRGQEIPDEYVICGTAALVTGRIASVIRDAFRYSSLEDIKRRVKPGDVLYFKRKSFYHVALYLGKETESITGIVTHKVMNVCAEGPLNRMAYIRKKTLDEEIYADVERYDESKEYEYDFVKKNCEYYCHLLRYGKGFSTQRDDPIKNTPFGFALKWGVVGAILICFIILAIPKCLVL